MGDMYAVDLALNLRATVPSAVVDELRWHLGTAAGQAEGAPGAPADELTDPDGAFPLLAERGPAWRIGGLLVGELHRTACGWALTARQEVHAECLSDLDPILEQLARHSSTEGVIGQIRFYEDHVPELLISESGTLVRMALKLDEVRAVQAYLPR
ncbi:hypothetical protein ACIREK_12120 [Streptomyces sp. NPDC102415]|uniref:hypothetical protein n=1 Tax=Streptomyces sp. NPDC102415 TaxID=3366173 RepID=UPI0037FD6CFD